MTGDRRRPRPRHHRPRRLRGAPLRRGARRPAADRRRGALPARAYRAPPPRPTNRLTRRPDALEIPRDPDDAPILPAGEADFLVTGDRDILATATQSHRRSSCTILNRHGSLCAQRRSDPSRRVIPLPDLLGAVAAVQGGGGRIPGISRGRGGEGRARTEVLATSLALVRSWPPSSPSPPPAGIHDRASAPRAAAGALRRARRGRRRSRGDHVRGRHPSSARRR